MHSLSASSIRVCHPGPAARNASTTSGDSRIETASFLIAAFGRPSGAPPRFPLAGELAVLVGGALARSEPYVLESLPGPETATPSSSGCGGCPPGVRFEPPIVPNRSEVAVFPWHHVSFCASFPMRRRGCK